MYKYFLPNDLNRTENFKKIIFFIVNASLLQRDKTLKKFVLICKFNLRLTENINIRFFQKKAENKCFYVIPY